MYIIWKNFPPPIIILVYYPYHFGRILPITRYFSKQLVFIPSPVYYPYHFAFPIIPVYYPYHLWISPIPHKNGSTKLISIVGSLHIDRFLLHTSPFQPVVQGGIVYLKKLLFKFRWSSRHTLKVQHSILSFIVLFLFGLYILPPFQNTFHSGFSIYNPFVMHLYILCPLLKWRE
jgi:hypothetical protein